MPIKLHENNEDPDAVASRYIFVESGTGVVSVSGSAAKRGNYGLAFSVGDSSAAYMQAALADMPECYIGYWLRITAETMVSNYHWLGTFRTPTTHPAMGVRYYPNDRVQLYIYEGSQSDWSATLPSGLAGGGWHYIRAGYKVGQFARFWVDDNLILDHACNPTGDIGLLRLGPWTPIAIGGEFAIDCDDLKIGTTLADVEPCRPYQCGPVMAANQPAITPAIRGGDFLTPLG